MERTLETPGQRISARRAEIGVLQKDLASSLGVRRVQVSAWENDHAVPSSEVLPGLARELGTTVDWLLTGADVPEPIADRDGLRRALAGLDAVRAKVAEMLGEELGMGGPPDLPTLLADFRPTGLQSSRIIGLARIPDERPHEGARGREQQPGDGQPYYWLRLAEGLAQQIDSGKYRVDPSETDIWKAIKAVTRDRLPWDHIEQNPVVKDEEYYLAALELTYESNAERAANQRPSGDDEDAVGKDIA